MKDIRSLYSAAKYSGKQVDIDNYTEAVNTALNSNPKDYITNLKYIIQSDIGLNTFQEFVDKYGISIAAYDNMLACFESCVEQCENQKRDASIYKKYVEYLKKYQQSFKECFDMFDYMNDGINIEKYLESYYSINENGITGSKLPVSRINTFGMVAIPDTLITAYNINENNSVGVVLEYLGAKYISPEVYQVIVECCKPILREKPNFFNENTMYQNMKNGSLSSLVESVQERNRSALRDSLLLENTNTSIEITESDVKNIIDLIRMKEFQVVCTESTDEITKLQNEIYSLYEEFDGILNEDGDFISEDSADTIVPMLPPNVHKPSKIINKEQFDESLAYANTTNKKTGDIPGYLSSNHDLNWGEDDNSSNKSNDEDISLDDVKRPSAEEDKSDNNGSESLPDLSDDKSNNSTIEPAPLKDGSSSAVNNYYYYTYNNSMNKNSHSFNRDGDHDNHYDYSKHSRDDHSNNSRRTTTDNSIRISDDHSSEKNANNHNESVMDRVKINIFGKEVFTENKDSSGLIPSSPDPPTEQIIEEKVAPVNDQKPQSDNPLKDTMMDVDRQLTKTNQNMKKGVQKVQQIGLAARKPVDRTVGWIKKSLQEWKDKDENKIKEKMADPHARNNLFESIKWCIKTGSLLKAGLLLNPVFIFLSMSRKRGLKKNEFRIRSEMIGELKTELEIIDEKIQDADRKSPPDTRAKYKLMRLRNEINKKLVRVGGSVANKKWTKGDIV